MAHDVFVSYSAKDKTFADGLCATLESKRIRCWIAPRDVLPGENYAEALIDAINTSRIMVLIFSSNSNSSPHVSREVERAVNKGIPIIPVRIENVIPTKAMEYFLCSPHWLDAFTPPLDEHLNRLAETVQALLDSSNQTDTQLVKSSDKTEKEKLCPTRKCVGCGKSMPSSLEYCTNCGKKLTKEPQTSEPEKPSTQSKSQVNCTGCGKPTSSSLEFCNNCGKKLVKTAAVSAPSKELPSGALLVPCSGCGKSMQSSLEYCTNCGKKLSKMPQVSANTTSDNSGRYIS